MIIMAVSVYSAYSIFGEKSDKNIIRGYIKRLQYKGLTVLYGPSEYCVNSWIHIF